MVLKVSRGNDVYALKMCLVRDQESVKRFKREVKLMKSISHSNVIEILDQNLNTARPYFVMPLCKFSIAEKMDRLKKKPEFALRVLKKVCAGINAIHHSGVVHRDIKPQNILITIKDGVKVSDLGLGKFVKRVSTELTSSNDVMGTEGYIPPEFFAKGGTKNAGLRSDIYQLGKLIYAIFSGESPVHVNRDLLPGGLQNIVDRCIADLPTDRYETVDDLKMSLENYRISLDPKNNPISAFNSYIEIAEADVENEELDQENLRHIVYRLGDFKKDPALYFKQAKKIPTTLLVTLASDFPSLCRTFVKIYCSVIEKYFLHSHPDFAESEIVAGMLWAIFRNTQILAIKIAALKTTLIVSVETNRYRAMGTFDSMLKTFEKDQDAVAVAEMLRENLMYYQAVAERVPRTRLHPFFQKLQDSVLKKKSRKRVYKDDWK